MSFLSRIIGLFVLPGQMGRNRYRKIDLTVHFNRGKSYRGPLFKSPKQTEEQIFYAKAEILKASYFSTAKLNPPSERAHEPLLAPLPKPGKYLPPIIFQTQIREKNLLRMNSDFTNQARLKEKMEKAKQEYITHYKNLEEHISLTVKTEDLKTIQKNYSSHSKEASILEEIIQKLQSSTDDKAIRQAKTSEFNYSSMANENVTVFDSRAFESCSLGELQDSFIQTLETKKTLDEQFTALEQTGRNYSTLYSSDSLERLQQELLPALINNLDQQNILMSNLNAESKREALNTALNAKLSSISAQISSYEDYPEQYLMDQIPYFNDPLNNAGNKAAPTSLNIFNTDLQMAKKHLAKLSLDYGIDAKTVIYKGSTGKKNEIRDISLETVEITPPHFSEEKSDYILNFCGNAQNINDSFEELADMANDTNSRVVSFNYRTVGRDNQNRNGISRVASFQELVEDGIAQVQALLNRKIPPYKIKLYGHSLGGAVAAAVAAHFHSQTPSIKIYLVNGRSFTNVENVIKQNFKKYDNDAKSSKKDNADEIASPLLGKNFANETIAQSPKESILQRIKNWFGNRCAKLATDNGWKIDTAEYCKNIDPNYIRTFEVKGDQIMPKHTETLGPKDSHTIFDVYVPPNLSAHELRTYCHNVNVRELYLPQGAGKRTYFYSWLSDVFKTWNDRDAVQNTHNVDAGIIHNEPEFRLTKAPENKPESPKVLQQAEVNEPLSPKMQPNYSSQEIGFFGSPKSPAQRLSLNHVNKGSQGSDNSDNSDNSNKHSLDSRHTNGLQKSELSSQKGLEQENMKNSSCSPF